MMIAHWMGRDDAYQLGNEGDFSTRVARGDDVHRLQLHETVVNLIYSRRQETT
jgi:hypothetical protein